MASKAKLVLFFILFYFNASFAYAIITNQAVPQHLVQLPNNLSFSIENQQRINNFLKTHHGGVAVFDADGTLWADDVGEAFLRWLIDEHKLLNLNYKKDLYAEYKRRVAIDKALGYAWAVQVMAGLSETDIKHWANTFFQKFFINRIYQPQKELISRLKHNGFQVWIVTASNRWIVAAGAPYVGVQPSHVIGINLIVQNGRLTHKLIGPITYKEGKVKAIKQYIKIQPSVASGDSEGDLQMLQYAKDLRIFIKHNPTQMDKMVKFANQYDWITQYFPLLKPLDTRVYKVPSMIPEIEYNQ